VMQDSITFCQI